MFILYFEFIDENIRVIAERAECADKLDDMLLHNVKRNHIPTKLKMVGRLIVVGGGTNWIEYLCPITNKWKYWKQMPFDDKHYQAAVFDNFLYVCSPSVLKVCSL